MSPKELELKNTNEMLLNKIKHIEQMIIKLQEENKLIKIEAKQMESHFNVKINSLEDTLDLLCSTIQELKNNKLL